MVRWPHSPEPGVDNPSNPPNLQLVTPPPAASIAWGLVLAVLEPADSHSWAVLGGLATVSAAQVDGWSLEEVEAASAGLPRAALQAALERLCSAGVLRERKGRYRWAAEARAAADAPGGLLWWRALAAWAATAGSDRGLQVRNRLALGAQLSAYCAQHPDQWVLRTSLRVDAQLSADQQDRLLARWERAGLLQRERHDGKRKRIRLRLPTGPGAASPTPNSRGVGGRSAADMAALLSALLAHPHLRAILHPDGRVEVWRALP